MKRILILLFIIGFLSPSVFAQRKLKSSEVPQEVLKSFGTKYTAYKKVIWRKMDVLYEAEVFIGKKVSFVTFEANGNWVETLTEIKLAELPAEVVAGVKKLFSSAKLKAAAIIEQSTNVNLYIVQFRYKGKRGEVTLDSKGVQS